MESMITGKDLYRWRKTNRLTQQELADKIGYSMTAISHYEYTDKVLSKRLISRIKEYDAELHPVPKVDAITQKVNDLNRNGDLIRQKLNIIKKEFLNLLPDTITRENYNDTVLDLNLISKILPYLVEMRTISYISEDVECQNELNETMKKMFNECRKIQLARKK